jgi:Protein of unknown function (DUF2892)
MRHLATFMLSTPGRWLRVILGVGLIVYGLFFARSVFGYVLAVAGVIPLVSGATDRCGFAGLAGLSCNGSQARASLHNTTH